MFMTEAWPKPQVQEEAGENLKKSLEELEKELPPEIIEMIMNKIQDIDKEGTAYTVIRENDLASRVVNEGLLATEGFENKKIQPDDWKNKIRQNRDLGYFFNIAGREADIKKGALNLPRINYSTYFSWQDGREPKVAYIFDSASLKEDDPYRDFGDIPKFKSRTFRANRLFQADGVEAGQCSTGRFPKEYKFDITKQRIEPASDFGFLGTFRLPPRLLKGIVIRPEIDDPLKYLEDNKSGSSKFSWRDNKYKISKRKLEYDGRLYEKMYEMRDELLTRILQECKNKETLLPIYSFLGDVIWPKFIAKADIERYIKERDKNKQQTNN